MPVAPDFTSTVRVNYVIPLPVGDFDLNADDSYNSGWWSGPDNLARQGAYNFVNALLGWTSFSLLLGTLAIYWGVSALRMKPEQRADARAAAAAALSRAPVHDTDPRPTPPSGDLPLKPQRTAARSGIVTGGIALLLVAASFSFHLVYQDYYECTQDALTSSSRDACAKLLPTYLRDVIDSTG